MQGEKRSKTVKGWKKGGVTILFRFSSLTARVRNSNLGLCLIPFKGCVSQLSVDRFGENFGGLLTLGQVKSVPNFCSFGPQRAEIRNI